MASRKLAQVWSSGDKGIHEWMSNITTRWNQISQKWYIFPLNFLIVEYELHFMPQGNSTVSTFLFEQSAMSMSRTCIYQCRMHISKESPRCSPHNFLLFMNAQVSSYGRPNNNRSQNSPLPSPATSLLSSHQSKWNGFCVWQHWSGSRNLEIGRRWN